MSDGETIALLSGLGLLGFAMWYLNKKEVGEKAIDSNLNSSQDVNLNAGESITNKSLADSKGMSNKELLNQEFGEALEQKRREMSLKNTAGQKQTGLETVRPDVAQEVKKSDEAYTETSSGKTRMISPFSGQVDTVRNIFRQSPSISSLPPPKITAPKGAQLSATSLTKDRQFGAGVVTAKAKEQASIAKNSKSSLIKKRGK